LQQAINHIEKTIVKTPANRYDFAASLEMIGLSRVK
jgi:hypothetical protein